MLDKNTNDVSASLVDELLREKRSDRHWKNIRFIAWFLLFLFVILKICHYLGESSIPTSALTAKYIALIRVDGLIAPDRDFSATNLLPILKEAFADKNAVGVMIDINSPGGTPVQAAIIHDAILEYKKKYHKKVVIVGEDLLTSGAYYVAVAADKIYVNPNTLTGSIGVIIKGFGFVDLMKKIGVERRVYTAGSDKDRLDPFLPQSKNDLEKIQAVMREVHANFVQAVLNGRKGKLHADTATLFNGDFWSGQSAFKMGLVDGLGNLNDVAEKEFHTARTKEYGNASHLMRFLSGGLNSAFDKLVYL